MDRIREKSKEGKVKIQKKKVGSWQRKNKKGNKKRKNALSISKEFKMKKYILLVILFSGSIFAQAQNPPMLLSFEINRFQNEIIISWEIESGNLCSGVQVEHSSDSISFTTIYDYPGVCGSSTANESYTFSHTNPISNAKNYYRINLGTNGISEILSITFVKLEENGYTLFPMPIEFNSKIYFTKQINNNYCNSFNYTFYGLFCPKSGYNLCQPFAITGK